MTKICLFQTKGNLYITAISLFLCFVIKRLVILISTTADLAMEKKFFEIEKVTIHRELSILKERVNIKDVFACQPESSMLSENSKRNTLSGISEEKTENVESLETRSRSRSRTNEASKKVE